MLFLELSIYSETFGCSKLAINEVPFSQVCILSFIREMMPSYVLKFSPVNRPCIISKFAFIYVWLKITLTKFVHYVHILHKKTSNYVGYMDSLP